MDFDLRKDQKEVEKKKKKTDQQTTAISVPFARRTLGAKQIAKFDAFMRLRALFISTNLDDRVSQSRFVDVHTARTGIGA